MSRKKIVEIKGLNKSYGTKSVLDNISVSVFAGETVALIGNNAAGKTTLLDIIAGSRKFDEGTVEVFGLNVRTRNAEIKKYIGYLPQSLELPDYLTVGELISLFSKLHNTDNIGYVMKSMNLGDWADTRYKNLSGGLKRRTCAACILCSEPKLVLMDEPTSGMDATMSSEVWNIVRTMSEQGISVMVSTHSLADALSESDRVIILDEGKCVYYGKPDGLSKNDYEVSVRRTSSVKKHARAVGNDVADRIFNNVSEMSEYILRLKSEGIRDEEITIKTIDRSVLEGLK